MSTVFNHLAAAPMDRPDQYFATPPGSAAPAAAGHDGDAVTPREAPHASRAMTGNLPTPTEYVARAITWSEDTTEDAFRGGFAALLAGMLGQAGSDCTLFALGSDPADPEPQAAPANGVAAGAEADADQPAPLGSSVPRGNATALRRPSEQTRSPLLEALASSPANVQLPREAVDHWTATPDGGFVARCMPLRAACISSDARPAQTPARASAPLLSTPVRGTSSFLPALSAPGVPGLAPPASLLLALERLEARPGWTPSPMPSLQDALLLSLVMGCSADESAASAEALAEACTQTLLLVRAWQLTWTLGRRMHRALGRVFASNPRPPRK